MNILIMHGPNLNLIGVREPEIYGKMTLSDINKRLRVFARKSGVAVRIFQRNCEGELITLIHKYRKWADGIVINPGAYTHYSYAIRDALAAVGVPTIEVHLSNIRKREKFRRISVIAPVCIGHISGYGWKSYLRAIQRLIQS